MAESTAKKQEKQDKEISFEAAMARLEEIVRSLESGTAPLDESLSMFEEGVHLVSLCNGVLERAERRIRVIEQKGSGEYSEGDFEQQ